MPKAKTDIVGFMDEIQKEISQSSRELLNDMEALERWFVHAETVAQTRLYNFLMSASIIILACAALFPFAKIDLAAQLLVIVLAGVGLVMSVMWFGFGGRQAKLLSHLGEKLDELFAASDDKTRKRFPLFHVKQFKKTQSNLNLLEYKMNSRVFLLYVPLIFAFTFLFIVAAVIVV